MGKSNKICPRCGRKMKQQFIGLQHCGCGMSWNKDYGILPPKESDQRESETMPCYTLQG